MDISPADLRTTFDATRTSIVAIVDDLDDAALATVVPTCPDWSVQDLVAHLTSSAAEPQRGNLPGPDADAWLTANVEARRGRSMADLLDEWAQFGPSFGELIEQFGMALHNVTFDVVCHEHDIRHALGQPGNQTASAVRVALGYLVDSLAGRLAESDLGAVELSIDDDEVVVAGEGEVGLSLATTTFEAFRLLSSRRSEAQVRSAGWEGDVEAYLGALDGYGYPTSDVIETSG